MGFQPKLARQADGLETGFRPPVRFLAGAVQFAMVCAAQWDRELVADLEAETAGLRKPQMVGVAGLASADEAGLFRNEPQMRACPAAVCVSGRVSTLLSMRERVSSFAAGWSNSAGWWCPHPVSIGAG